MKISVHVFQIEIDPDCLINGGMETLSKQKNKTERQ